MGYAVLLIAISIPISFIIAYLGAKYSNKQQRANDYTPQHIKRIKLTPAVDLMKNTDSPYNENDDGYIDLVKKFYPAVRLVVE